jgi:hypothetical protein
MPRNEFEPNKSSAAKFLIQISETTRKTAAVNTSSCCGAYQSDCLSLISELAFAQCCSFNAQSDQHCDKKARFAPAWYLRILDSLHRIEHGSEIRLLGPIVLKARRRTNRRGGMPQDMPPRRVLSFPSAQEQLPILANDI